MIVTSNIICLLLNRAREEERKETAQQIKKSTNLEKQNERNFEIENITHTNKQTNTQVQIRI